MIAKKLQYIALCLIAACSMFLSSMPLYAQTKASSSHAALFSSLNLNLIITSDSAVLAENKKENHGSGKFYLLLKGVAPYVTYSGIRPSRIKGLAPLMRFVEAWKVGPNSFEIDNPTAILTPAKIDGEVNKGGTNFFLILSKPRYYPKQNALLFEAQPLQMGFLKTVRMEHITLIING